MSNVSHPRLRAGLRAELRYKQKSRIWLQLLPLKSLITVKKKKSRSTSIVFKIPQTLKASEKGDALLRSSRVCSLTQHLLNYSAAECGPKQHQMEHAKSSWGLEDPSVETQNTAQPFTSAAKLPSGSAKSRAQLVKFEVPLG